MVDFRYHVVSIVAVFLALGIGIVVGTTAINPGILDNLHGNISRLTDEKRHLEGERRVLSEHASDADAWGQAVSPMLVTGLLAGERVVLVSAPGVDKAVRDGVADALVSAGARVSGRIRLADSLSDPRRATELDDLVVRELPSGLTLPGRTATSAQRALAEIAYVVGLSADDPVVPASPPAATTRVLAGLRERGFLAVDGAAVVPARNVVVLLPGAPPPGPTPSPTVVPVPTPVGLDFVSALSSLTRRPAVVVVSPTGGSVAGAPLEALRADDLLKDSVSTVDDADSVYGRTALVLALREARRGGQGHYGNGVGAEAPIPTPSRSP